MNRYRLIRRLLVASGCAGGAGMLIYRVLLQDGPGGLRDLGFFVMMVVLAGMGICLQFGLDAAARALTPRNSADARVTWWAYVVFWAAVVAMQGWLMVRVGWPMITKHGSAVGQTAARGPAD